MPPPTRLRADQGDPPNPVLRWPLPAPHKNGHFNGQIAPRIEYFLTGDVSDFHDDIGRLMIQVAIVK